MPPVNLVPSARCPHCDGKLRVNRLSLYPNRAAVEVLVCRDCGKHATGPHAKPGPNGCSGVHLGE